MFLVLAAIAINETKTGVEHGDANTAWITPAIKAPRSPVFVILLDLLRLIILMTCQF